VEEIETEGVDVGGAKARVNTERKDVGCRIHSGQTRSLLTSLLAPKAQSLQRSRQQANNLNPRSLTSLRRAPLRQLARVMRGKERMQSGMALSLNAYRLFVGTEVPPEEYER
jgi:hypothetical protein